MRLLIIAFAVSFIAIACAESASDGAAAAPTAEYLPPIVAETAPLTKDGYQYRTVRHLKYRQRREAPSTEYLPPVAKPSTDYIPPVATETHAANDGYRYKTVRRLKVRRHRREAPSNEYLPPVAAPTQEYLPPGGAPTQVANDGYRYKTIRRLRFRARHRRDVSELPSLPSAEYFPPVNVELAPDLKTVLGNDGYRYKTVRRLRYRRRRREIEGADVVDGTNGVAAVVGTSRLTDDGTVKIVDLPNGEYLPPSNDLTEVPAVKSAELAPDGYRYKIVRRVRYRYRH
ncbi:uncharacterized protein [Eurosta solidaginis]|uniref:uncharacterized protein n=1 Tax=Eurosta solidaginis TaxID=178769 RepID=UPI0035317D25